jgi:hypothetical protein
MRIVVFNAAIDPERVDPGHDWRHVHGAWTDGKNLFVPTNTPDLYDDDSFVVDGAKLTRNPGEGGIRPIQEQIDEMVRSGGCLIVFAGNGALGWLPVALPDRGGSGTEISVILDTPLTTLFTRYQAEARYQTQFENAPGWQFAARALNNSPVGAFLRHGHGAILILPTFKRPNLVVRDILRDIVPDVCIELIQRVAIRPVAEDKPQWLDAIELPAADKAKGELNELAERIAALELEQEGKLRAWQEIDRFRDLLWATGERWLEPIVQEALSILGVSTGPERPIDLVHHCETGEELWIEVEGSKNSIQVDKGGQLLTYMGREPERAARVRGIIIGNPYRLEHPDNRPPAGNQDGLFTRPLVDLAGKQGWVLMTTVELFELARAHLSGDGSAASELRNKFGLPST